MLSIIEHLDNDSDRLFVEKLYDEYMPFLKSRAYKYVNNYEESEDIAHECMLNMMKSLDKLKNIPENKSRSYFCVSINNASLNYLKRMSREIDKGIYDLADDYYLTDGTSVEEELEQKCDYETLRESFLLLNERDKDLIKMKYDLELDDSEIAEVFDVKPSSVRMLVYRSVQKLVDKVKKQEGK